MSPRGTSTISPSGLRPLRALSSKMSFKIPSLIRQIKRLYTDPTSLRCPPVGKSPVSTRLLAVAMAGDLSTISVRIPRTSFKILESWVPTSADVAAKRLQSQPVSGRIAGQLCCHRFHHPVFEKGPVLKEIAPTCLSGAQTDAHTINCLKNTSYFLCLICLIA